VNKFPNRRDLRVILLDSIHRKINKSFSQMSVRVRECFIQKYFLFASLKDVTRPGGRSGERVVDLIRIFTCAPVTLGGWFPHPCQGR